MDEDEAALLAELRAISNRSGAASRFQDDGNEPHDNDGNDWSFVSAKSSSSTDCFDSAEWAKNATPTKASLDVPWKKSKTDVAAAESAQKSEPSQPEMSQNLEIKSSVPSTFKGDRGGAAKDEELLAELRAISAKSSGAHRFAEDSDVAEASLPHPVADVVASSSKNSAAESVPRPSPTPKRDSGELAPWKRGKTKSAESSSMDVEIVVAAPSAPTSEPEPAPTEPAQSKVSENVSQSLGIKSNLPSTFKGDRGGAAKDDELLAELRAISAKSSGANRFAEG